MPGPLSPDALKAYADPAYLTALVRAIDGDAAPAAPPSRSHTPMHVALGVMGGGQLADALSTKAALDRGGTQEANPLYGSDPSLARVLGTKAAIMAPTGYALDKLYNQHPKLALALALGLGGLGMGLAAHNAKVGR